MKDLTYGISLEHYEEVLKLAQEEDYNIFIYENGLQDSLMVVGNKKIRVGRAKPRKYIIIQSVYLNEWSSKLVMTMTDNEQLAKEVYNTWEQLQDELEQEYA